MQASELITSDIPPLKPGDSIGRALGWMEEFKVSHLPVVDGTRLVGFVTDRELVDRNDPLGTVSSAMDTVEVPFVRGTQHIYAATGLFSERGLTVVPVLDDLGNYMGVIDEHTALRELVRTTNVQETGSVVVLEMNRTDYSLHEITRIVEEDGARILSVYSHGLPDSMRMNVTLKINREDVSSILRAFERYNYGVRSTYQGSRLHDDLRDRYDELMRFISF